MKHIPPRYYGYVPGTFAKVTACVDCQRIALYNDQHPVNACPDCGGKVKELCSGRWEPPIRKWRWTLKPIPKLKLVTVVRGYWVLRGYINQSEYPSISARQLGAHREDHHRS